MRQRIRSILISILNLFAWFFSCLIRFGFIRYFKLFFAQIEWYSIKRQLGAIGANATVSLPIFVKNPQNIFIGNNFFSLPFLRIETFERYAEQPHNPKIIIGNNVALNFYCHIGCIHRIEIGDNVVIASRVYITDHFHGEITYEDLREVPAKRKLSSRGPVIIHNNVLIGEGVAIMPGVTIGKNSIIGANAVVTSDIPENCVAAGVPARVLRVL